MEKKTAIVTGGTKGIGKGICRMLLMEGYTVYTNYASDDKAAAAMQEEFKEYSSQLSVIKASQETYDSFVPFIRACLTEPKGIHVIVCNAGATVRKPTLEIENSDWEKVFNVTLNSHFYLIRDLMGHINPNGRIIFIGSLMGIHPHATVLPYGVSKAAVHALAKNLVKDFAGTGTTVNVIAPGFVETEWQATKPKEIRDSICSKTAIGRFAEISEIVDAVKFCINNPFLNGSLLEISGGYSYR